MSRLAKFIGLKMTRAGLIPPRVWNKLVDDTRSSAVVEVVGGELSGNETGQVIRIPSQRPGQPGGALCPKWNFQVLPGTTEQLAIRNPGTIGGEMPEYDGTALDADPAPEIIIPGTDGVYHLHYRFEWEPDSEEIDDDIYQITGGTLVEPIEVIVTAAASPPSNQFSAINQATGAATTNGIYHRRFGSIEREGDDLKNPVSDYCYSMELLICPGEIKLGST